MAYYGFEHRYGSDIRDDHDNLIGKLVVFRSRRARDEWVEAGNPYFSNPGARTAVKSLAAAKFRRISAAVEFADN